MRRRCGRVRDRGVPRRARGLPVRDHRRDDRLSAAAGPGLQAGLRRRRRAEHRRDGRLHAAAVGAADLVDEVLRDGAAADRRRDGRPRHAVRRAAVRRAGADLGAASGWSSSTPGSATRRPSRCWRCSTRRSAPLLLRRGDRHAAPTCRRRRGRDGAAVGGGAGQRGLPGVLVERRRDHRDRRRRRARRRARHPRRHGPRRDGDLVTAGGRVLAVVGDRCRRRAPPARRRTRASPRSSFDGAQHRTDIAAEGGQRPDDLSPTSWPPGTPPPSWPRSGPPSTRSSLERQLWLAVLRAQQDLGVDVPRRRGRGLRGGWWTRSTSTRSPRASGSPGTT